MNALAASFPASLRKQGPKQASCTLRAVDPCFRRGAGVIGREGVIKAPEAR